MTTINRITDLTAASTAPVEVPHDDEAAITALNLPGGLFSVRLPVGQRETVVSQSDFASAQLITGNPVAPTWSDPWLAIDTYQLRGLVETAQRLLVETFGVTASLTPHIAQDPESGNPSLVLELSVPLKGRGRRDDFLDRYVQDTTIPKGAPAPSLVWSYQS